MMKKIIAFILSIFLLTGCSLSTSTEKTKKKERKRKKKEDKNIQHI